MKQLSIQDLYRISMEAMDPPRENELLRAFCHIDGMDDWSAENTSYWPMYNFIRLLVAESQPDLWVECGLELGRATAFAACGCAATTCIGIEINSTVPSTYVQYLGALPNVHVRLQNSIEFAIWNHKMLEGQIGILHIDSSHEYNQTLKEWSYFRPLMAPGGIVLFDDIECPGVRAVWDEINTSKIEFDNLHGASGFGAVMIPGDT